MTRNCCDPESSCSNNNCYNSCNNNGSLDFSGSWLPILAIFLIFGGGGFGSSSFWSGYNNVFRCSGFNTGWCNNSNNGFNNNSFNSNNSNNNFNSNNLSNSNLSNSNFSNDALAGLLGGLSGGLFGGLTSDNNSDINNLSDSSN